MPSGVYNHQNNPSLFKKGHQHSQEVLDKISKSNKGHKPPKTAIKKGQHLSPNTEFKKGMVSNRRKKTYKEIFGDKSGEIKRKMSEAKINHPCRFFKDTKIELKIEAELKKRNINYQKQVPLCKIARVDFYLPEYRIVIQCDGDYWHNLLKQKEKDERQDKVLIFNGFNVFRFWEYEINKSAENCINSIWKKLLK